MLQKTESSAWNHIRPTMKQPIKNSSNTTLRALGLTEDFRKVIDTLEDLRKTVPGIIIARSLRDLGFTQNWSREQLLKKGNQYVMGLGVYKQLEYQDKNTRILVPGNIKLKNIYKPYQGQDLTEQTLVVSRTGGVGDLLFIQPNLRYLKNKYPTCTIKFACGPQYQSMVETWDCIDIVLDLPFHVSHLFNSYHAFFEGVIERCKQAEKENAYNLFSKWLGLDLPDELLVPRQEAKQIRIEECKKILHEWNLEEKSFLILQPRASSPIRSPSQDFYSILINKLTDAGYKVVITDMVTAADGVQRFIDKLENKEQVFNFARYSIDLDYTIAMTSLSKLVIGTDSALMHIGNSLGIPCFGIYGPFPGFIRLKTYKNVDWVDAKMECAPCYLHGSTICPTARKLGKDYSPCYDQLDQNEMIMKIERLLDD